MSHHRRAWWGAAAGFAVAWLLLPAIPGPARFWSAVLIVPLPVAAAAQLRLIGEPAELPRMAAYVSSAISLWLLAFATALAAWWSGFSAAHMGLSALHPLAAAGWTAGITAAGMAAILAARWLGVQESPILHYLLPRSRRERLAFAGLSLTAGLCEEFIYRGFLIHSLEPALGSAWAAAAISAIVFGWMHSYQQFGGAMRAALLGIVLAVPTVLTGSIVPSILAHTAIDILGGIVFQRRLAGMA